MSANVSVAVHAPCAWQEENLKAAAEWRKCRSESIAAVPVHHSGGWDGATSHDHNETDDAGDGGSHLGDVMILPLPRSLSHDGKDNSSEGGAGHQATDEGVPAVPPRPRKRSVSFRLRDDTKRQGGRAGAGACVPRRGVGGGNEGSGWSTEEGEESESGVGAQTRNGDAENGVGHAGQALEGSAASATGRDGVHGDREKHQFEATGGNCGQWQYERLLV